MPISVAQKTERRRPAAASPAAGENADSRQQKTEQQEERESRRSSQAFESTVDCFWACSFGSPVIKGFAAFSQSAMP